MALKANILYLLSRSKVMLDKLVESLESDDDWFYRPDQVGNPPIWIVAHLGLAAEHFASRFESREPEIPDGWDSLFWFGSTISDQRSDYPTPANVLQFYQSRRAHLVNVIEAADESILMGPAPEEGMFSDAPNLGSLLFFTAFHEGVHLGQFTVAHRALGNQPLFQPQPSND